MIELKHSDVVFNEAAHTYTKGAEKLSGITSLIHSVLRLGVYPKADQETIEVRIPRAGYYGKCVHEAIRMFNDTGIDVTEFPEKEHQTKHYGLQVFPGHDVSKELENYKLMLTNGRKNIASEFTVSFGQYASQIDAVWEDGDGVYLVDFKTNNLDYRFVYYLLGAKGICVVPSTSFCTDLKGFRVTLLEEDEEELREVFTTIHDAIVEYLHS
jgi:hypothetical protein